MSLKANQILEGIYAPPDFLANVLREEAGLNWKQRIEYDASRSAATGGGFPLPPVDLRMNQAADDHTYLESGHGAAYHIRYILHQQGIKLAPGDALLDWGCASGRVVRHFSDEASRGEVWGVDQHGSSILWAKENLSPPFKFVTGTAFPHLPFEDGKFKLIYGISVFTHIIHLMDTWLVELKRILAPNGCALFTVLDEHSWQRLTDDPSFRGQWLQNRWLQETAATPVLNHDVVVIGTTNDWSRTITFFRRDWLRKECGAYYASVAFEDAGGQSWMVLRKDKGRFERPAVISQFDSVGNDFITGWIWDKERPADRLMVDIYDGDSLLATVAADQLREDVRNAGIGDGRHAFQCPTPPSVRDGQPHTIHVMIAGTKQPLDSSPQTYVEK